MGTNKNIWEKSNSPQGLKFDFLRWQFWWAKSIQSIMLALNGAYASG